MIVLMILSFFVLIWAGVATYYLWHFARIILILESDFSEATDSLQNAEQTLDGLLQLPMFFDSPEVQKATMNALDGIRTAKISVAGLVRKFTERSKQKYVEIIETTQDEAQ